MGGQFFGRGKPRDGFMSLNDTGLSSKAKGAGPFTCQSLLVLGRTHLLAPALDREVRTEAAAREELAKCRPIRRCLAKCHPIRSYSQLPDDGTSPSRHCETGESWMLQV